METVLVHPDSPEAKVTVASPIEMAAFKSQGFVEEAELALAESLVLEETKNVEELEELRAKLADVKGKLAAEKSARKEVEAKLAELEKSLAIKNEETK
jgi:hypothetical protein